MLVTYDTLELDFCPVPKKEAALQTLMRSRNSHYDTDFSCFLLRHFLYSNFSFVF